MRVFVLFLSSVPLETPKGCVELYDAAWTYMCLFICMNSNF